LDPFNDHTDKVLFEVVEGVGLYKPCGGKTMSSDSLVGMSNIRVDSLNNIVSAGGSNFSVGQCRLLAISRALLLGTKIARIDEGSNCIN
jgi:hypothetical protein